MKARTFMVLGGLGAALAASPTAAAHEGAGGNIGIGVGIGAPTALSLEVAPVPWSAFELALGLPTITEGNMYAHLVYKLDVVRLASSPGLVVPLYIGLGGFVHEHGVTDWGARFPLGVNFDFRRAPIQLFAEAAVQAVVATDAADDEHPIDVTGFGGVRVWF
jgi:hypothetical protein